ncbi:phosphatidylinositol glycan anchor biosynthesis class U protein-like isoform X2 [Dendronephthya gigantea]|uniref:phosphatidylinositol glycan anchor biosynthesis class U protein-like isoform X2 n=1 Tax=Dendronephthya gigantea TaxID=151771 RepID=UPI00106BC104|nr:phosphatidylinositol glycan anchor biosynthesis class U protein-like isoform X2 [Dendronephthya gigantea]
MAISLDFVFVLFSALVLRCLLFVFDIHNWIYTRIQFTTPITSWKRVLEGLSLLDYGISPYSGDTVHESPLVLAFFHMFPSEGSNIRIPAIFVICDLLTGIVLYKSAQAHCKILLSRQQCDMKNYADKVDPILLKPDNLENIPVLVFASYLLNPFTLATCVAQSTGLITNLSVSLGLYCSLVGSTSLSMFFIAFAAHKSLYPVMLVIPLALILTQDMRVSDVSCKSKTRSVISTILWFVFWSGLLLCLSRAMFGSWQFLDATYGFTLRVPELTPNMGLFWYLFLEMFDHFREFFILVFQLNAFFYIIPLFSLLRNDPVFLFYTLSSVIAIFKSYPAFGDFSIPFALLISWSHLYPYMRNVFFVSCMFLISSTLAPLFWYLWIYAGSANANFFYAATLAYSTAQIFLLGDVIFAFLRRNFDLKNGISRTITEGERMTVMLK